ncbi:MAG TPA: hypothetical protein VIL46_08560, partial [Gemmataceae bacterium]
GGHRERLREGVVHGYVVDGQFVMCHLLFVICFCYLEFGKSPGSRGVAAPAGTSQSAERQITNNK